MCWACQVRVNYIEQVEWDKVHGTSPRPPGLTTTYSGWLRYQRNRARAIRQAKLLDPATNATPVREYGPRVCLHCKQLKRVADFAHPRWRICIACDGPQPTAGAERDVDRA